MEMPYRENALRKSMLAAIFACAALLVALFACALPAQAKSYTCESDILQAGVGTDGSLQITETRTFDFDGSFTLVGVILDPPKNGEYRVSGVSVDTGSGYKPLERTKFKTEWRNAGGPGGDYYCIDTARDTIYCFSSYYDVCSVQLEYSYTNAVNVHKDIAELYWEFIGTEWEVDPNYVELDLALPVPAGEQVVAGENVRAWGHGPLSGNVAIHEDGQVAYTADDVKAGQFVEARVTFPPSWVPGAASVVKSDSTALDGILAEEQGWADKANQQRFMARLWLGIPGAAALLMVLMALVTFFRKGKEYKPLFQEDYWRDVPAPGVDPAVVARVYRFGEESNDDITASLMHLSSIGAVKVDHSTIEREGFLGLGTKTEDDYRFELTGTSRKPLSDMDRATSTLLFDQIGKHGEMVTLDDVKKSGKKDPERLVKRVESWQKKLTSEVEKGQYFEEAGETASGLFTMLAVGFAIIVGVVSYLDDFNHGFGPIGIALVGAIITYIIAQQMPRRSHEAAEIKAKCDALKRWFKDFTNLKEAIPTDVKVWGEMLVYAHILGVSREVIEGLRVRVPQLWDNDDWIWYSYWYWSPSSHIDPIGHSFGNVFDKTVSTARAAISSDSSGGGGGGGFSGGGGGGFGGGGGGFAR